MSEYTPNLNLFKYNTSTDGKEVFSIEQALNHNWDILDQNSGSRNIGEIVASTIPLTDAGLHLLDGSLLQYGSYKAFIDYIAGLVSSYPDLFVSESDWQDSITSYGVCGKFVYDSTNNTVRLPKITGKIDGTTDVNALGDLAPLFVKLPNITGNIAIRWPGLSGVTGCFGAWSTGGTQSVIETSSSHGVDQFNMSASRSSSVYSGDGTDTTIHEQAISVLYYIVIATSTKTDIQVDIDEIATDLNGKADVSLNNVNTTGSSVGAGWTMPSDTYEELTLGASGATYTAPANGWFCIKCSVVNQNSGYQSGYTTSYGGGGQINSYGYSSFGGVVVPMLKGQTLTFLYENNTSNRSIRFVYAQGTESEAS